MWAVPRVSNELCDLGDLEPEEVLGYYDGPILFTTRDREGNLLLANQCDINGSTQRFLVVPISPSLLADLREGRVSLRDTLTQQGWTWLVDLEGSGNVVNLGQIDPATLPIDALPRPEAYL